MAGRRSGCRTQTSEGGRGSRWHKAEGVSLISPTRTFRRMRWQRYWRRVTGIAFYWHRFTNNVTGIASSDGSRVISFFASQSLHNKKIKNKSGDVNDEANFSFCSTQASGRRISGRVGWEVYEVWVGEGMDIRGVCRVKDSIEPEAQRARR